MSEFLTVLMDAANRQTRRLLRHRERYVKAWIAATGLRPMECELVEERYPIGPDNVMRTVVRAQRRRDMPT